MNVVLRHSQTSEFYTAPGQWTSQIEQARVFVSATEAILHAECEKLQEAEVLFHLPENPVWDFTVPHPERLDYAI